MLRGGLRPVVGAASARKTLVVWLWLVVLATGWSVCAVAQTTVDGAIRGTVVDGSGAAVYVE